MRASNSLSLAPGAMSAEAIRGDPDALAVAAFNQPSPASIDRDASVQRNDQVIRLAQAEWNGQRHMVSTGLQNAFDTLSDVVHLADLAHEISL